MVKKIISLILPFVIGGAILAVLLYQVDVSSVKETLRNVSALALVPFIGVLYSAHFIAVFRWQVLLRFVGVNISYPTLLKYFFANLPLTKIFPLYSGDFLRTIYVKEHISLARGSGVILFESLVDVVVLLLFVVVGGLFAEQYWMSKIGSVLLVGCLVGLWLVSYTGVRGVRFTKVNELFETIFDLSRQPWLIMQIFCLSACMWLCTVSFTYGAFKAIGTDVSFLTVIALQPVATMIALLPVSFGGVGTREVAMVVLYAGVATSAAIVSAGVLYTVFAIIVLPLICTPLTLYVIAKHKSKNN